MSKILFFSLLFGFFACKKQNATVKPTDQLPDKEVVVVPDVYVFSDKVTWSDEFDTN